MLGLIDDNRNRFTILRSLTLLRRLRRHAALVDEKHGKAPSAKIDALLDHRPAVVKQFKNGRAPVFLISLKQAVSG